MLDRYGRLCHTSFDCSIIFVYHTHTLQSYLILPQAHFCRLKVDENAPSLPTRSLKRGRGRGSSAGSASREEGSNLISSHSRGRGGSRRSRGKGEAEKEKEGAKATIKVDNLVTKQASRFRPRTSSSSNRLSSHRQRTNNKLNVVSGKSEERIEPEKALRAEKLKKSR